MPDSESRVEEARERRREIATGFAIIWGLNLLHLLIGIASISIVVGIVLLTFYLVIQALYSVVLIVVARNYEQYDKAKGMMIAAAVTTLVSSTCTYGFMHNWR